ncbi:MAG: O-antigen ligase family protein [Chitinophagales bacterium]|nr:O-antigen ligase family protein [Chitinophagales bacterium]
MRLQFPLELLAPATVALILAGLLFFRNEFRFLFTDFAVLLFIAVAGMSVVSSVLPITSIKSFSVLTTYVITFYFAFRFLQLKKSHWQIIWQALLVGYSALLLYTLFRYFNMGIHRKHSYEMSLPFVPGHTLLIAIGFPVFLYAINQLLEKTRSKLHLTFVLLFAFVTAISYSRIYWVMLLLSIFVFVFYRFKKIRIGMIASAVVIMIAGSIAYHHIDTKRDRTRAWDAPDDHNSLFVQIQSIFVWEKNESNIERSNRWKVAREIFKAHPVVGAGLNTYPEIYFWYKEFAGVEETNLSCVKMNSHQIYLGWLSEMGIFGFISGIFLFISFLVAVIRLRGSPHFVFGILLFLNFILLGIIEDFTTLEKIMAVFWISLAYVHHLSCERKSSS